MCVRHVEESERKPAGCTNGVGSYPAKRQVWKIWAAIECCAATVEATDALRLVCVPANG
jgi:hypothetical protein